jgi:hypothetical protein
VQLVKVDLINLFFFPPRRGMWFNNHPLLLHHNPYH